MTYATAEALVAALEACAQELERQGDGVAGVGDAGSLPRLRPPSLGVALGRVVPLWPAGAPEPDHAAVAPEVLELAAEFRDVALEVQRGNAGRGWLNSLLGRASRYLQPAILDRARAAALGVL
jgi:hypothetical protein